MSDERRDDDRSPDFRSVELVTTNGAGNEKTYPVTLRDASGSGLGGMYVGEDVLSPAATFVLRESDEDEGRRVRIVWSKRVADYVQMLGLEVSKT
jgi:hypothetical protein